MYTSLEAAAVTVLEVICSCSKVQIDAREYLHMKKQIVSALKADTGGYLNRLDYLTRERMLDVVRETGFATTREALTFLFPNTVTILQEYT